MLFWNPFPCSLFLILCWHVHIMIVNWLFKDKINYLIWFDLIGGGVNSKIKVLSGHYKVKHYNVMFYFLSDIEFFFHSHSPLPQISYDLPLMKISCATTLAKLSGGTRVQVISVAFRFMYHASRLQTYDNAI